MPGEVAFGAVGKLSNHEQLLGVAGSGERPALGLDANRHEFRAWLCCDRRLCCNRRQCQRREDCDGAKRHGLLPVALSAVALSAVALSAVALLSGLATTISGTSSVSTTCETLPSLIG